MAGDPFRSALNEFQTRLENPRLSTGSLELDTLLGGVEAGRFYLLSGDEEEGVADRMLHILLVSCLRPGSQGGLGGKCVYLNCGNYKRTRTMLDVDLVTGLINAAGLDVASALRRIYTICAFSEDQQMRAVDAVGELLEKDEEIRLVAVQQIAKLFSPPRLRGGRGGFQRMVLKLRQMCAKHHVALVATCRPGGRGVSQVRWPEGGDYLNHEAGVIVYFRAVGNERLVATAYLLKHPERGLGTCEIVFAGR